jgi:hypothetical protein
MKIRSREWWQLNRKQGRVVHGCKELGRKAIPSHASPLPCERNFTLIFREAIPDESRSPESIDLTDWPSKAARFYRAANKCKPLHLPSVSPMFCNR